ncbi:hypothetical protein OFY05_11420 [Pseudocitrobacter faecalis]|nr:hypothetical protein OFY05_11420 [Pseudocitrobacter faecalis]
MKERGMIFNGEMVRAILNGRKTQTRRTVKLPHIDRDAMCELSGNELSGELSAGNYRNSPHGKPGDRIWVRETFGDCGVRLVYRADTFDGARCKVNRWTPSIHMPRWASRILLEITDVRVERLNDISECDAKAEGAPTECTLIGDKHYPGFRSLWKSIYGDDSWQANPWVWVIEFKRIEGGAA